MLSYIKTPTLCYTTLHYTALHYTALHFTTLREMQCLSQLTHLIISGIQANSRVQLLSARQVIKGDTPVNQSSSSIKCKGQCTFVSVKSAPDSIATKEAISVVTLQLSAVVPQSTGANEAPAAAVASYVGAHTGCCSADPCMYNNTAQRTP
eukprot:10666-Heterococcus_DN1.PRE.1